MHDEIVTDHNREIYAQNIYKSRASRRFDSTRLGLPFGWVARTIATDYIDTVDEKRESTPYVKTDIPP